MRQNEYRIRKRYRLLVDVGLFIFNKIFRVNGHLSEEVKKLDGPYLLLSNHIGTYDPFIISYFLKKKPHFISSDAIFRDPFFGYFLKRLGVIPKKKNVRDTQVIRDMVAVANAGGALGLFPEGTRSWTGTTLHIEPSIAKLVKLLELPVVTAKMKGMHLTNPRWAFKLRKSAIQIDYSLTLSKDDILKASSPEVLEKIRAAIFHDEVEYQRDKCNKIRGNSRAEYLSYVLFHCPACKSIGKIESTGNDFVCTACGQKHHVNPFGFFEKTEGKGDSFDNIRDWFDWQRTTFENFIQEQFRRKTYAPLFTDESMEVYRANHEKMEHLGSATISFYINRLLIRFENGKQMEMPIEHIQTLNPQLRERIEIIFKDHHYRITSHKPGISGLKWEIAVNAIWQLTGQGFKQSTYLVR
ncbi:MAG: 1-acyl-sn-glycerol-3-phosphate acyltransferase [Saprospiraceae bacterium]|nr:1-acyl-sn-glycerol-3-phosphate acyltransferase [Saprospiraceae bacterium]MCB9323275.1 1-acyl-sn-glycerol-3-phosphate acyltransferase [Lewinellaceae bacterium]